MPNVKTFTPPRDRLTGAACRRPEANPDWWTQVHSTRSHRGCFHALARHMCLAHCPVQVECEQDRDLWGVDWNGMVIAGSYRTVVRGKATAAKNQPDNRVMCHICLANPRPFA